MLLHSINVVLVQQHVFVCVHPLYIKFKVVSCPNNSICVTDCHMQLKLQSLSGYCFYQLVSVLLSGVASVLQLYTMINCCYLWMVSLYLLCWYAVQLWWPIFDVVSYTQLGFLNIVLHQNSACATVYAHVSALSMLQSVICCFDIFIGFPDSCSTQKIQ